MCGLATTPELDVQQVSVQSQLKHGGQSGKRIGHLILLPRNVVEGYVIEELCQLLDVGLVGYQLMIPSLPFSSQLVNYQG